MRYEFVYDDKLELKVPHLYVPIEELSEAERSEFYAQAQRTTSRIPVKIKDLDTKYMRIYHEMDDVPDRVFEYMDELNRISEQISELNLWFMRLEGHFIQSDNNMD